MMKKHVSIIAVNLMWPTLLCAELLPEIVQISRTQ